MAKLLPLQNSQSRQQDRQVKEVTGNALSAVIEFYEVRRKPGQSGEYRSHG